MSSQQRTLFMMSLGFGLVFGSAGVALASIIAGSSTASVLIGLAVVVVVALITSYIVARSAGGETETEDGDVEVDA